MVNVWVVILVIIWIKKKESAINNLCPWKIITVINLILLIMFVLNVQRVHISIMTINVLSLLMLIVKFL